MDFIFVSPEIGDTVDHARSSSMSAENSCVQPTSHISFLISFKVLQVSCYGRDLANLLFW